MKLFRKNGMALIAALVCINLASCGGDEDVKKYDDLTLSVGDTRIVEGDEIWESDNELIVAIDGSELTAVRVGEAKITSSNYAFKVLVNPTNNSFQEPCLDFGYSLSSVKKQMNGYTLERETDEAIMYKGKGNVSYYLYGFENQKLKMSFMLVSTSHMDNLVDFLLERYVPISVDEDDGYIGMASPDAKMLVLITAEKYGNSFYYSVSYANVDSYTRTEFEYKELLDDVMNANGFVKEAGSHLIKDLYLKIKN